MVLSHGISLHITAVTMEAVGEEETSAFLAVFKEDLSSTISAVAH